MNIKDKLYDLRIRAILRMNRSDLKHIPSDKLIEISNQNAKDMEIEQSNFKGEFMEVKCYDCGMPYGGEDWIDTVLPNEQWDMIFPEHNGILCANCIVKRASKLDNIIIAKMSFAFCKGF